LSADQECREEFIYIVIKI